MFMEFAEYDFPRGAHMDRVWVNTRRILSMNRPRPEEEKDIYNLYLGQGHIVCVQMTPEQLGELLGQV